MFPLGLTPWTVLQSGSLLLMPNITISDPPAKRTPTTRHSTADQFPEGLKFAARGISGPIFGRVVKCDDPFSDRRKYCASTHRASLRRGDYRFTQKLI